MISVLVLGGLLVIAVPGWVRPAWISRLATPALANYVAAHPNETRAALLLAHRYLQAGSPGEAEQVLVATIQRDPTPEAWLLRSRAEFDQRKLAAAYASLSVAMPFLVDNPEARWRLGLLLELRGDERGAEREFTRAIELDPGNTAARLKLARSALAHRHYAPALQQLQEVVRREPRSAVAQELLAVTYRNLGDLEASEQASREAVRLAPDSDSAVDELVQLLQDRATDPALAEAEQLCRSTLARSPKSDRFHYYLGKIYFDRGDYHRAAGELREAVRLQPLSRFPYPPLIQSYLRLGDTRQAASVTAEYRKIDEMDLATAPLEYSVYAMPENTAVRVRLARLYLRYHRPDLAQTELEEVLNQNPSHSDARKLLDQIKKQVR